MAFLFKSKNKDRHGQSRDGTPAGPAGRVARDEKGGGTRSTPTGSVGSLDDANASSPDVEKYNARRAQQDQSQAGAQPPYQQAASTPPQSQQTSDLPVSSLLPRPLSVSVSPFPFVFIAHLSNGAS